MTAYVIGRGTKWFALEKVFVSREKDVQLPVPLGIWWTPMAGTVRAAIVLVEILVVTW
jgi:hypothetical protein